MTEEPRDEPTDAPPHAPPTEQSGEPANAGASTSAASPSLQLGALHASSGSVGSASAERGGSVSSERGGSSVSASRSSTPVPVAWRSWPVVDSIGEFFCLGGAMLGVPYVVWDATGNFLATLLCTAALATVVWRHFVPTMFEIGALGVSERFLGRTRRIPWISIDRFVVGRKGAFLSSAGAPLEALRGFYLPWGPHREQVLATLRYYLPRAEDPPPAGTA